MRLSTQFRWFMPIVFIAGVLLGCSAPATAGEGKLSVCAGSVGSFFLRGDEHPSGIEYEILASFARVNDLQLDINWRPPGFFSLPPSRLPELFEKGGCEVYAWTMTATPGRAEFIDFSEPYFPVRMVLIQLQGQGTDTIEALAGKKIMLVEGSYFESVVRAIAPEAGFVYMDTIDVNQWIATMKAGEAHAAACDSSMAAALVQDHPELMVSLALTEMEYFAFAMPKGSSLKAKLDSHIHTMKENGDLHRALVANFGPDIAAMVAESLGAKQ